MRLVSLPESSPDVNPPAWTDATATGAAIDLASRRRASLEAAKRIALACIREGFGAGTVREAMADYDSRCEIRIGPEAISAAVHRACIDLGKQPGASW